MCKKGAMKSAYPTQIMMNINYKTRGFFFLFLLFTCFSNAYSGIKSNSSEDFFFQKKEKVKIQGKIIDTATKETIPYCNIQIANSFIGTSSNELGEFEIIVDQFPVELTFSHISYSEQTIRILEKKSNLLIELTPATNVLEEIILSSTKEKVDNYAIALAKKAFKRVSKSTRDFQYGKAFYRQKSKNSKEYSEFSEIIYDVRYNVSGIIDWNILEGRYALKEEYINNKNFSRLSYTLKSIQPDTKDAFFPLKENLESFYDVRVKEIFQKGNYKVAILKFTPKKLDISTPLFSGEAYIDTESGELFKVTGKLTDDRLKIILLKDKDAVKKDYQLTYEMVYKKDSNEKLQLDYININQEFDYLKNGVIETHISSSSSLAFFEHYQPITYKKLGGRSRRGNSDWERLNTIGYNQKFWEENPIVKRTPVEKEVIDAFEKKNSIEPIFLNSRKQIAAMQSRIGQDPFIKKLNRITNAYNNYNPIEKVFVHFDKTTLFPGENLWYTAYVTLGEFHHYSTASEVLYIDLVDKNNKVVASEKKSLFDGKSNGQLQIPFSVSSDEYQLRAYTDWMKNFDEAFIFKKTIEIGNLQEGGKSITYNKDIDLQFFPEGGNMIANIAGRIAFKATNSYGYGVNLKGKIVDSKGNYIRSFQTKEKGMGLMSLKPNADEIYTAVLENGMSYQLPKVVSSGYHMFVNNINSKNIKIKVQASPELKQKNFYVIGHVMNQKYFQGRFNFGGNPYVNIEIPKNRLPSGVVTLTLFDQNMKPWCERIVFVNNQDELIINTSLDKERLAQKGEVQVNVLITDTEGRPVATNFSMAITNKERIEKNPHQSNILTHLLLESDIKGSIENPDLFFKDQKRATKYKLDLVMLTNGWRRFNWQKMKTSTDSIKKYSFTKGFLVSGIAKKMNGKVLSDTRLDLITKSKDGLKMHKTKTSSNGQFTFKDLVLLDSTKLVFNAYSETNRPIDIRIELDERKNPMSFTPKFLKNNLVSEPKKVVKNNNIQSEYKKILQSYKTEDSVSMIKKGIVLDEVKVRGRKKVIGQKSRLGIEPDAKITIDGNQPFLNQIANLPGVTFVGSQVPGSENPPRVSVRGSAPLWVVDGIPIASIKTGAGNGLSPSLQREGIVPLEIRYLNPRNIERVEVLKDIASTAQYGSRGGAGVILIYTKQGKFEPLKTISPEFDIIGLNSEKEFYIPKYEINTSYKDGRNLVSTLYWNPSLTTNKDGLTSIIFQNQGSLEEIQISIEALSEYGVPGSILKTFSRK